MLYTVVLILIVVICILLTLVILLQSGQGQGLSGGLAAMGPASQMIGARRTADILSKATGYLGGAFLVMCVLANFFIDGSTSRSAVQSSGVAPIQTESTQPGTGSPSALPSTPVQPDSARN
jgi:preprotein translocase subunit SecG